MHKTLSTGIFGLEVIVFYVSQSRKWVRFISHFMFLYIRYFDLDLPKMFVLF